MSDFSAVLQRGVARIALPTTLIRFLGAGLAGLATQTCVFTLMFWLHADKSLAWLVGMLVATTVTWGLNRRFTFGSSGRRRRDELVRYMLVTAVAQSVSFAVFRGLVSFVPRIPPSLDVILGAGVATIFSYTGQRFFTFSQAGAALAGPESDA